MSDIDFLVGCDVQEISYSTPGILRLIFERGEQASPKLYADLGPSEYTNLEGVVHLIAPDVPATLGPVLALVGQSVIAADTPGGCLVLAFSSGAELRCRPHETYEAWEVAGGSPADLVVCLPGGELAVWDETPD